MTASLPGHDFASVVMLRAAQKPLNTCIADPQQYPDSQPRMHHAARRPQRCDRAPRVMHSGPHAQAPLHVGEHIHASLDAALQQIQPQPLALRLVERKTRAHDKQCAQGVCPASGVAAALVPPSPL